MVKFRCEVKLMLNNSPQGLRKPLTASEIKNHPLIPRRRINVQLPDMGPKKNLSSIYQKTGVDSWGLIKSKGLPPIKESESELPIKESESELPIKESYSQFNIKSDIISIELLGGGCPTTSAYRYPI